MGSGWVINTKPAQRICFFERCTTIAKALRLNDQIRISPIRVIDQHQTQLGVIPTEEALSLARESGLDLVEVSPMERPPVCRIMDYGKYKYDRKKRQKQSGSAHIVSLKEIRIRPKTDPHDREIKVRRALGFLGEGHKVQFTMLFRGRERFLRSRAIEIFGHVLKELGENIKVERTPTMEGRRMTMVVSVGKPTTTPKPPKPPKTPKTAPVDKAAPATSASPASAPVSDAPVSGAPAANAPAPNAPAANAPETAKAPEAEKPAEAANTPETPQTPQVAESPEAAKTPEVTEAPESTKTSPA